MMIINNQLSDHLFHALKICEEFEYQCIAKSENGTSAEIWRCKNANSNTFAFDLVLTRMGIAAFGDMDPLVFNLGATEGIAYLARADPFTLYKSLHESIRDREVELEKGVVFTRVGTDIIGYLNNRWAQQSISRLEYAIENDTDVEVAFKD